MIRLYGRSFTDARNRLSGAAQFLKGIAEITDDEDERDRMEAEYRSILRMIQRLGLAQEQHAWRELQFRMSDPEGWETARAASGGPVS